MLDLDTRSEARALIQYAEVDGADPEPTALEWKAATKAEVRAVVREVFKIRPELKGSEWYEDFLYAHDWNKRHPNG
jgi:hypothetical protein